MGAKILIAVTLGIVVIFGIQRVWSNYNEKEKIKRGTVAIALEDAKATGKKEVQLLAPIPYYASVNSLDDALSHYTTVLAEPVRCESRISTDSRNIETWCKFHVLDYLSEPEVLSKCNSCLSQTGVPAELLPINDDEVLVPKNGGTIVSDDIKVTANDSFYPPLKLNQQYFLFLSLDRHTRIASIELGPKGVLAVGNDGDLEGINPLNSQLAKDLKSRYGKVGNIREQLKFRRFGLR